ncbi:hypothetical protein VIGAN_11186600 [Vigna angularis var. angularis]|uniref:Uncharacterized protein n=1 Tax=Vigna angularis var. angularis TaxID=157739 RepID=A0A0S3TAW9_PHAAN|nr:hypothetical protein VIGAN_11186600 [Vigna angularis var. angularis]
MSGREGEVVMYIPKELKKFNQRPWATPSFTLVFIQNENAPQLLCSSSHERIGHDSTKLCFLPKLADLFHLNNPFASPI